MVAGVVLALATSYRVAGILMALVGAAWSEIMGHLHLAAALGHWMRMRCGGVG